ncbi:type II secretion system protein, partial [Novacetimonas hansenii]
MNARHPESGFTLLEVMVAFIIGVLALGVLWE